MRQVFKPSIVLILFISIAMSFTGCSNIEKDFPYPTPNGNVRVMTWNIERLGERDPLRTPEQIRKIAKRILTFDAGVIVLQEINVPSVLETIKKDLGNNWQVYHDNRQTALLYDTAKVEMISVEHLIKLKNSPDAIYPGWDKRYPVSGVFKPKGYPDSARFRVMGVHHHYAEEESRKEESIWLLKRIRELLNDQNETQDIIVLGDFNSEPPNSYPHITYHQSDILNLIPKINGNMTRLDGLALDHHYVTNSMLQRLEKKSAFVVRPEYYGETAEEFKATYSDHLPIFIDVPNK
jgi:endonuclease/exonuclease/phosphatase family metal-dependent hydrolase